MIKFNDESRPAPLCAPDKPPVAIWLYTDPFLDWDRADLHILRSPGCCIGGHLPFFRLGTAGFHMDFPLDYRLDCETSQ
jgi:hypothetical protein